ncbi:hypothetical protein ACOSQ2_011045 [Xanthoceras sorbifolium]
MLQNININVHVLFCADIYFWILGVGTTCTVALPRSLGPWWPQLFLCLPAALTFPIFRIEVLEMKISDAIIL